MKPTLSPPKPTHSSSRNTRAGTNDNNWNKIQVLIYSNSCIDNIFVCGPHSSVFSHDCPQDEKIKRTGFETSKLNGPTEGTSFYSKILTTPLTTHKHTPAHL